MQNFYFPLYNRTVLKITGRDAAVFLQRLLCSDILALAPDIMHPSGLLTAQGKLRFTFLIAVKKTKEGDTDSFWLDIQSDKKEEFQAHLNFYKLAAAVQIVEISQLAVFFSNQKQLASDAESCFIDKRFMPSAFFRIYKKAPQETIKTTTDAWQKLRVDYGIAEAYEDYALGSVYPYDINLDYLGGVSVQKGCYIGQEVLSRMYHRKAIKKRLFIAQSSNDFLPDQTTITAQETVIGRISSVRKDKALAFIRLDKAKQCKAEGRSFRVGGQEISLAPPPYAPNLW